VWHEEGKIKDNAIILNGLKLTNGTMLSSLFECPNNYIISCMETMLGKQYVKKIKK